MVGTLDIALGTSLHMCEFRLEWFCNKNIWFYY